MEISDRGLETLDSSHKLCTGSVEKLCIKWQVVYFFFLLSYMILYIASIFTIFDDFLN